jgi:pimeloyl-ACP methyl ester carboxylesterase
MGYGSGLWNAGHIILFTIVTTWCISETFAGPEHEGRARVVLTCARLEFYRLDPAWGPAGRSVLFWLKKNERMGFQSQFLYPTTWYSKLVIAVLALAFFGLLAASAISGYALYEIILPTSSHSDINLQNFPGHPETLTYSVPGAGQREGWFFPGLKSAPTVVLCPGYHSSRGELLPLASALQDHQYNVLLLDFSGQGTSGGRSTLGFQEVAELRAAINAVANRGDVDAEHFGVWGANIGAYVALSEAVTDKRVRAVAAESPYGHPNDMLAVLIGRMGIGAIPLVVRVAKLEFGWLNPYYRNIPPLRARVRNLSGVAQLYMATPEDPALAESTQELFQISPAPHDIVSLPRGNYAGMLDEEKTNYENRIVSFFLTNLPPAGMQ